MSLLALGRNGRSQAGAEASGLDSLMGWAYTTIEFTLEIEIATPRSPTCGDGVCEAAETIASCPGDCPGITTPTECGEEPHSNPAGEAVAWGSAPEHRVRSAAECCQRCMAHAAKNTRRPCNSWSFCYLPHCWSLDNGNTHTHGECWLKAEGVGERSGTPASPTPSRCSMSPSHFPSQASACLPACPKPAKSDGA
ncbi:hypothetical protein EMIHUDRAFT_251799 [Emiliania huxleyi CCMP1516]|uniref:Apple domain-containing protein n=2 Tax=Emiliania huxleyi TaxID=2903 RepID=A0A0D3KRM7_EMIH1|nr:hypothetical protein EMIHUDRAFT_251799 [Emiliania huxleyi CCMP1516]EOD38412.1 hypothetical protein EMIHUDRAFT_251799 [Emiliania huxleyi CCMP1516]|eukprot:XP_005790841.1 hypothetical protein EMIHUDRAFT_251799 [Emiliania huxleyi CCMP1516]